MMVITFLMTAFVGLAWAFAFAKTNSLYLSIGLHFGWNFFNSVVFSNGYMEQAMFVRANGNQLHGLLSWLVFIFQVFALPLITFWYLNRLSIKQKLPVEKEQPS